MWTSAPVPDQALCDATIQLPGPSFGFALGATAKFAQGHPPQGILPTETTPISRGCPVRHPLVLVGILQSYPVLEKYHEQVARVLRFAVPLCWPPAASAFPKSLN